MSRSERDAERLERRYQRAVADQRAGHHRAAAAGYGYVLNKQPDHLAARNNLAAALAALGWRDAAAATYRMGLETHPDSPELHANLGHLLSEDGDLQAAADHYGAALDRAPGLTEVRYILALVLRRLGRSDEARAHLRWVAAEATADPRPGTALAAMAVDAGRPETALKHAEDALSRAPDDAAALNMRGVACKELARFDDARAAFDAAIGADPGHAEARYNRAVVRLLKGELPAAWADYEWRWRGAGRQPPGAGLGLPTWRGEPLDGRTVLVVGEQGFGDTIQFIRYAPLIKDRGGRVVLQCRPELTRLMQTAPGVDAVCGFGTAPAEADLTVPLLSLPGIFETKADTIPFAAGYLEAPSPAAHARPLPRVGLVWAGSPTHENDRNRSVPPAAFGPVLALDAIDFVSLQMGPARDRLEGAGLAGRVTDMSAGITDFADTAAALAGLDLLISADTVAAHLAGAMGRPAWVLLPAVPDWRWMLGRADTPWYQTLRLFRQTRPGDWDGPLAAIARELHAL